MTLVALSGPKVSKVLLTVCEVPKSVPEYAAPPPSKPPVGGLVKVVPSV